MNDKNFEQQDQEDQEYLDLAWKVSQLQKELELVQALHKVAVREKSKSLEVISASVAGNPTKYSWIEFDSKSLSGTFLNYPERELIPENIKEQLIVELYSK